MLSINSLIDESVRHGIFLHENRNDINTILRRYFQRQIPREIGCNGAIDNELFNLGEELESDEYDDEYTENDLEFLSEIYRQYKNAMGRRRPGSVLEDYRFYYYITERAMCFNYGNSYIFGNFSNGYFKVSHFAPASMREGYEMLKEISKYDNVIFTVTSDLAPMLKKIGFYGNDNAKIMMFFRNELVNKQIYTTDRELLDYYVQHIISNKHKELYNMLKGNDEETDYREMVRKQKPKNYAHDENDILFKQRVSMHDRNYR